METLKIAAHTFDIGTPYQSSSDFKKQVLSSIEESLNQGANLVLLPEYLAYALSKLPDLKTKEAIAKVMWTEVFPEVMKLSEAHDALIFAGTAPNRKRDEEKFKNRALLAASGKSFESYKRCLAPWENDFESGSQPLLYEWKGFKFANLIGFDLEFPELSAELKRYGPHFVLCPVATADEVQFSRVKIAAQARAMELGAVVVLSALVGEDLDNPLVDSNEGACAFFYPIQNAFHEKQGKVSPYFKKGNQVLFEEVDLLSLSKAKRSDGEMKPYLKNLNTF